MKVELLESQYCVKPLGVCIEHKEAIISWCEKGWGHLRPEQPNYTRDLIETRLSPDILPISYVVFDKQAPKMPIGTFALTHNMIGIGDLKLTMLNNLYVDEKHRGQGVAKQIVKMAENIARNDFGIKKLQLGVVELSLKTFYTKLGWTLTEETTFGEKKVYVFAKDLQK